MLAWWWLHRNDERKNRCYGPDHDWHRIGFNNLDYPAVGDDGEGAANIQ